MMFSDSEEEYHKNPVMSETLNLLLILHADHEQNCSTSTVRLAGSSKSNIFGAISSGIAALWGPLHGGANQAVIEMEKRLIGTWENTDMDNNLKNRFFELFKSYKNFHKYHGEIHPEARVGALFLRNNHEWLKTGSE